MQLNLPRFSKNQETNTIIEKSLYFVPIRISPSNLDVFRRNFIPVALSGAIFLYFRFFSNVRETREVAGFFVNIWNKKLEKCWLLLEF